MHIVTDAGADLATEQRAGLEYHTVPLTFTLDGRTYRSGIDIQPEGFYDLLNSTSSFPITSQPAPGEFAALYRDLAATGDGDVLSIHISSGLSGTLNAARLGAQQAPEAHVTFVDTLTLSAAQGWQVEAAARMSQAGTTLAQILPVLAEIGNATETCFTLSSLRYLEHGGRISHLQALVGQLLDLKPLIGVEKAGGTYVVRARERSFNRAVDRLCDVMVEHFGAAERMRIQVMHASNPAGAARVQHLLAARFDAHLLPVSSIAPVLGAHTGPGLVGVVAAPARIFAQVPEMS